MSETATDRDLEMLAWLAERDMEAVAHAHARFLAATEPDDVASLGRTYQRVSRCLRSTIALKLKAAEAKARTAAFDRVQARRAEVELEERLEARTVDLQDAVARIGGGAIADPAEREIVLERFDEALDDWMERPDFLTDDLDEQVARAARLLGLPEQLAARWRDLPRPAPYIPPDDDDEVAHAAGPAPSPRRDSG